MSSNIIVSCHLENTEIQPERKRISAERLQTEKKFTLALQSKLPWVENQVLSILCRGKYSINKLSSLTSLDRKRAIPAALKELSERRLAACHDGFWYAIEPHDMSLFSVFNNPKPNHWFQSVNYFKVFTVSDGLCARGNALFCRILNHPGKWPAWYANTLNIPRRTVKHLLHGQGAYTSKELTELGQPTRHWPKATGLIGLGLVAQSDSGGCYIPKTIPDFWQDQFKTDTVPKEFIQWLVDREANEKMLWHTGWNDAVDIVKAASERLKNWLPKKYQREFWQAAFSDIKTAAGLELFVKWLPAVLDHVEATAFNRKAFLLSTLQKLVGHFEKHPYTGAVVWFGRDFDPKDLFR